jgi:hypothetical protein
MRGSASEGPHTIEPRVSSSQSLWVWDADTRSALS